MSPSGEHPSEQNQNAIRWLRQRACGSKATTRNPLATIDTMRRIQLETNLHGHSACVNCLDWNRDGNLLASGSDDRNVIIWEPFKGRKRNVIRTGHEGNIFSVKFIPDLSDTFIATCASDGQVKLFDLIQNEILINCKSCHLNRVKRLVVHPNEPHLIWSCGEDGCILQYDIREEHHCTSTKPKNLLLDLKTSETHLCAKCLAINPIRDEMLAVGANDVFIRLFDRRYMRQDGWDSCTAYFTPGHLNRANLNKLSHRQSFGSTYLSFGPDGSELLANIHGEQVYLFNTYAPWERYKSFEETIKPLILDLETSSDYFRCKGSEPVKPYCLWKDMKNRRKSSKLPETYCDFYETVDKKVKSKIQLSKEEFDKLDRLVVNFPDCVELYSLRASALLERGWRGDNYQAIRDCCCAFAMNPLDVPSLINIGVAAHLIGDKEARSGLREILRLLKPDYDILNQSKDSIDENLPRPVHSFVDIQRQGVDIEFMDTTMGFENESFYQQRFESTRLYSTSNCGSHYEPSNLTLNARRARERKQKSFDYTKRFLGHCHMNTDIKEANFFGNNGEFIVGGSDDGAFYIWDKHTTNVVKAVRGDLQILNCLQPHPSICMLATSGIEPLVKIWSPTGKTCHDVESLELRCRQNQEFITSDPIEAMMTLLYPNL